MEGYDTCQKIKITLTSPAANFGLYDWAFEIYLKTGLAYELKETIIVAGAAENLEVSSQKLDVHGEYRVKGVLFHKGTTCTIAQLINEIETSECEKNIIPPTTECFDETCNPPCLCPSEGNERPPEEAGAIKIKLSESEVPEGGYFKYIIFDKYEDVVEEEEDLTEQYYHTEGGQCLKIEQGEGSLCLNRQEASMPDEPIEIQGHVVQVVPVFGDEEKIAPPAEGESCISTEEGLNGTPITVEYPILNVLACLSTQGPSTPVALETSLQIEGDGLYTDPIQRENEGAIEIQGDAPTTTETNEEDPGPTDPEIGNGETFPIATERVEYIYQLQDILLKVDKSTNPGSQGAGASVTVTQNNNPHSTDHLHTHYNIQDHDHGKRGLVIDNGLQVQVLLDDAANTYSTNDIAELLGELSNFVVDGTGSPSRHSIGTVPFDINSTLQTIRTGVDSQFIEGSMEGEEDILIEEQGTVIITSLETEGGEYISTTKKINGELGVQSLEKEIGGYQLEAENGLLQITTEDRIALNTQYNPPQFKSERIDEDDGWEANIISTEEGTTVVLVEIYDDEDNVVETRWQTVSTKDCWGIQTEENTRNYLGETIGITTNKSEHQGVSLNRLTLDCSPSKTVEEARRTISKTEKGNPVHYCFTIVDEDPEVIEIEVAGEKDGECLEAEGDAKRLIEFLTDLNAEVPDPDLEDPSTKFFVECIEGEGLAGKYIQVEDAGGNYPNVHDGQCLLHDFSDRTLFTETTGFPIEMQEDNVTLAPMETNQLVIPGEGSGDPTEEEDESEPEGTTPEGNVVNYCMSIVIDGTLVEIETEEEVCIEIEGDAMRLVEFLADLNNPAPTPPWFNIPPVFEPCLEGQGLEGGSFLSIESDEDDCIEHEAFDNFLFHENNLEILETQENNVAMAPLRTELAA